MNLPKRHPLFFISVIIFTFTALISGCRSDVPSSGSESASNLVETSNGPVRGLNEDGIYIFKGLRYAAAPVGNLRFKPPVPPAPWTKPVDAFEYGNRAMQGSGPGGPASGGQKTDEDCLFLNVWTPGLDNQKRPVMVWLHGGGFSAGSGGDVFCNGKNLSRKGDVVVVTVNHRLNVFGFLQLGEAWGPDYASSGQAGMLDIVMSLKWVRDNIERFGGDPGNVTIFGESGGGRKVAMLMAMEPAKGLFHKAIVQSGSGLDAPSKAEAVALGQDLLKNLDITEGDVEALMSADAQKIFDAQPSMPPSPPSPSGQLTVPIGGFVPCVDGLALKRKPFIPDAPEISIEVPLMIGSNKDEMAIFQGNNPKFGKYTDEEYVEHVRSVLPSKADELIPALRSAFPDYSPTDLIVATDSLKGYFIATVFQAERKAALRGAPVYVYLMAWETLADNGRLRAHHALDVPLVFDNVESNRSMVGPGPEPQRMADLMSSVWIAFARTGNPNTEGLPHWPAYSEEKRSTMFFDTESHMVEKPYETIRQILVKGNHSSTANRVSKPGEYSGYGEPIYADEYEMTSQYVKVSDGTKLAMDLYRPKDKATGKVINSPLPVLWMHTPYNRRQVGNNALTVETYPGTAARLIKYGYVVATVDFRGLYASYGHNEAYNRGEWMTAARKDAYDITEWLAKQPWSNGNIGMWGCSATGGSQMQATTTAPPHLKAVFPMSCEYDVYSFRVPGGMAPAKGTTTQAMSSRESRDAVATPVDADTDRSMLKEAFAEHEGTVENPGYTPYRDSFAEAITDPSSQPWWLKSSPHTYLDKINSSGIAMYMAANWDEGPTKHGAFFTFNNVTNSTKLIVGPEGHCGWLAVEKNIGFDITVEERRFFDYWLKGIDNGIMDEDPVYYYTYNAPTGTEWRSSREWPLKGEKRVKYYLGDASLSTAEPAGVDQKDEAIVSYDLPPRGQTPAEGLIYETAPLSADLQVTGHPTINLWVSSTGTDGDFIATILDVGPDGTAKSYNVHGRLRASMRKLDDPPYNNLGLPWHRSYEEDVAPLVPGQPAELEFDILPVSMVFKAGHRIRLVINFADRTTPKLDPAPKVTVYRDSTHRSYLTLPVIEVQ
jgi:carboxylesterase type B/predicted acyl esterase